MPQVAITKEIIEKAIKGHAHFVQMAQDTAAMVPPSLREGHLIVARSASQGIEGLLHALLGQVIPPTIDPAVKAGVAAAGKKVARKRPR